MLILKSVVVYIGNNKIVKLQINSSGVEFSLVLQVIMSYNSLIQKVDTFF